MRSRFPFLRCLLGLVSLLTVHTHTHGQLLDWVRQIGSTDADEGTALTIGPAGHIYMAGFLQDSFLVFPGSAVDTLISEGGADIFVSRLDSDGNLIWIKQIGGSAFEYVYGMATNQNGEVYIAGVFFGTTDFDPGLNSFNLSASVSGDGFVCKLDSSGNFVWAKQFGSGLSFQPQPVLVNGLTLDRLGNVLVTGAFDGPTDFDPGPGDLTLSPAQYNGAYTTDMFVLKLNPSGELVWAKQLSGDNFEAGNAIAVDDSGNVYTTGFFNGNVDFDPGPGSFVLHGPSFLTGLTDLFVSKLDSTGNFVWARQMGSGTGLALAVERSGFIYASGEFPGDSVVIYKLDALGNTVWTGTIGASVCRAICIDQNDNVFLTGAFHGTKDLDPGPGAYNLTAMGSGASFISRLDTLGNLVWVQQLGGTGNVTTRALVVDEQHQVYTTGVFEGTADFDPGASVLNITSVGSMDVFIHKLRPQEQNVTLHYVSEAVVLYPNPTDGQLSVELKSGMNCKTVIVRDILGKTVLNQAVTTNGIIVVDISEVPEGLYLLELRFENGSRTSARILKQ